jgi:hypothetical protein
LKLMFPDRMGSHPVYTQKKNVHRPDNWVVLPKWPF